MRYNLDQIENAFKRSSDRGELKLNISFEDFVKNSLNSKESPFDQMVKTKFISISDSQNMSKHILEFKKLGIDVTKLESLLPGYNEYFKSYLNEEPNRSDYSIYYRGERDLDELKRYEIDLENWHRDMDEMSKVKDEFEEELMKLIHKV